MHNSIYEDLEAAIVAALDPLTKLGVEVVQMADSEADFKRAFAKARISAVYHSSKPSGQLSMDGSVVETGSNVQLIYESRSRRGELGVLHLHSLVENILNGFQPENWKPVTLGPFEFDKRDNSVWTYNQFVRTEYVNHQISETYSGIDLKVIV